MYKWWVFLHVFGAMSFMLAHGASSLMVFQLKREKSFERMKVLLDLSGYSWPAFALTFLIILVSGIVSGFMGNWWGQGWIWTALVILLVMSGYMGWASRAEYHRLRKVLGMPYFEGRSDQPALDPASDEEIYAAQARLKPVRITVIGFGSVLVILWLMMFKPF